MTRKKERRRERRTTGIGLLVRAGEGDEFRRKRGTAATASDLDLRAFGVELLFTGILVSLSRWYGKKERTYSGHRVQGDGLKANEVVARRNISGHRGRPRVVIRNHLACGPGA